MRIVDLEKYKELRRVLKMRVSMIAGSVVGVLLFLLTVGAGFFGAVLFGLLSGGGMFGLIYGLRTMIDNGIERRRQKLTLEGDCIDVTFRGNFGLLEFFDQKIVYHRLQGDQKTFEIPLTEEIFVATGPIEPRRLEKLSYREIQRGYVLVRETQYSMPSQFVFLNVDGALDHVANVVQIIMNNYNNNKTVE